MFERFAAPTRRVLVDSEADARELGHHFIDTQHLVLGLLVLDSVGVAADGVKGWLTHPPATERYQPLGKVRMERIFRGHFTAGGHNAVDAARRLAGGTDTTVGSHHLLLGILSEPNGLGAKVLDDLGITTDSVEAKIAELGVGGTSDGPPPARVMKVGNGVDVRI